MSMYLSDPQKLHLKQIVELWDELGHKPSSAEFNAAKDTPDSNALAYYFGSYQEAADLASTYRSEKRRKIIGAKPAPISDDEDEEEEQEESATEPVAQSLSEAQEAPPPPDPPVAPKKQPKTSPKAPEAPKLKDRLVNFCQKPLVFVTDDTLSDLIDEELDYNEIDDLTMEQIDSSGVAIVLSADIETGSYTHETSDDEELKIPIISAFTEPKIVKNGMIHGFPTPQAGIILFVEQEVAEAARSIGRDTDDLLFPTQSYEADDIIYCSRLGKL